MKISTEIISEDYLKKWFASLAAESGLDWKKLYFRECWEFYKKFAATQTNCQREVFYFLSGVNEASGVKVFSIFLVRGILTIHKRRRRVFELAIGLGFDYHIADEEYSSKFISNQFTTLKNYFSSIENSFIFERVAAKEIKSFYPYIVLGFDDSKENCGKIQCFSDELFGCELFGENA